MQEKDIQILAKTFGKRIQKKKNLLYVNYASI